MKLIVGLGNPGRRYRGTRHNVGFRVVEGFASQLGIALDPVRFDGRFGRGLVQGAEGGLLEPQTFMNCSGGAGGLSASSLLPLGSGRLSGNCLVCTWE